MAADQPDEAPSLTAQQKASKDRQAAFLARVRGPKLRMFQEHARAIGVRPSSLAGRAWTETIKEARRIQADRTKRAREAELADRRRRASAERKKHPSASYAEIERRARLPKNTLFRKEFREWREEDRAELAAAFPDVSANPDTRASEALQQKFLSYAKDNPKLNIRECARALGLSGGTVAMNPNWAGTRAVWAEIPGHTTGERHRDSRAAQERALSVVRVHDDATNEQIAAAGGVTIATLYCASWRWFRDERAKLLGEAAAKNATTRHHEAAQGRVIALAKENHNATLEDFTHVAGIAPLTFLQTKEWKQTRLAVERIIGRRFRTAPGQVGGEAIKQLNIDGRGRSNRAKMKKRQERALRLLSADPGKWTLDTLADELGVVPWVVRTPQWAPWRIRASEIKGQRIVTAEMVKQAQRIVEDAKAKTKAPKDEAAPALAPRVDKDSNNGSIIVAMLDLNATSLVNRRDAGRIARTALGPKADPNAIKHNMSYLVDAGLIESRRGRGGGAWLTAAGIELAKTLQI